MNVFALSEITKSSLSMISDAEKELPHEGGKEMLLVDNVDDREFLQDLVHAVVPELSAVKKKKLG